MWVGPMGTVCLFQLSPACSRVREARLTARLIAHLKRISNIYVHRLQVPDSVLFDIIDKPIKRSKWMLWLIGASDTVWFLPVSAASGSNN